MINVLLLKEQLGLSRDIAQHINAHVLSIQKAAQVYFEQFYGRNKKVITSITFTPKLSGDYSGTKINIEYKDNDIGPIHKISYFVKTHQYGSTSRSASMAPVDLKELFAYKVLEYIGFGPKVHFIANPLSSGGFYIATQDAAFTKETSKSKFFHRYEDLEPKFKAHLASNNKVDHETSKGISAIDILSRILVLTDAATNATNFGQVTVREKEIKWKIIDFRAMTISQYGMLEIYEGFKLGNGRFNYPETMATILRHQDEPEKINTSYQVITEFETGKSHRNTSGKKNYFWRLPAAHLLRLFIMQKITLKH
jgi:hypothetical protein